MRRAAVTFAVSIVVALGLSVAAPSLARAEPPNTHEIIYTRPSGFWTSNRPAVGGAYRWRLLGIGAGIALLTGALMLRAVKKASAERDARDLGKIGTLGEPAEKAAKADDDAKANDDKTDDDHHDKVA